MQREEIKAIYDLGPDAVLALVDAHCDWISGQLLVAEPGFDLALRHK